MAVEYRLSAVDIIRMLGCTEPVDRKEWEETREEDHAAWPMDKSRLELFEEEYHQKLPSMLHEFLNLANDNPLFQTADIWAAGQCGIPYFSYEDIEQRIEEDEECWARWPEKYEDNEYYQFSKMPREQWKDRVSNYLQIGSDYAAGVVSFGICETDLMREDPPVYCWNEDNSITDWRVLTKTLSDFLGGVVCDMLSGVEYSTVRDILEEQEESWEFCETEYGSEEALRAQLTQRQTDLDAMRIYPSFYGEEEYYRICADEDAGALYLVRNDRVLLVICRVE